MTQNEQAQYEKALARATAKGIQVVGRGTIKATKQQFIAVTSSTGDGCYTVIIAGYALVCNCKAGQAGRYCIHRALARHELVSKAAAQVVITMTNEDAAREVALPYRPVDTRAPFLYLDTQPMRKAVAGDFALTERVKEDF